MSEKNVLVLIDNRIRLMSAVLAVTDWPERAQQRKGHRPHAHARSTTRWLADFRNHPAVQIAQWLLNQNAPLQALYTYALKLTWPDLYITNPPKWVPEGWNDYLYDLLVNSNVYELWNQDADAWNKAQIEADSVLKGAFFYEFLQPFVGEIRDQLIYMPNISYPSDMAVGIRIGKEIVCIGPPRIAWGDNPPWPFDEDQGHIYSTCLAEYARLLMLAYLRQNAEAVAPIAQKPLPVDEEFKALYPTWGDQFTELFVAGSVALYLEKRVSPQEAKAFILMEKKAHGVTILPGVVSVLQRYLNEYYNGRYQSFLQYLPHFPGHLRVAKTISAL